MPDMFPKKGRYRHFKGGEYRILEFARHSETDEWMVVYQALSDEGRIWVRPLSMWEDEICRDGVTHPHRFTYVGD